MTSLQRTSLTHSLLFVSATPVLLALYTLLARQSISPGELVGVGIGAVGTITLAGGASVSAEQKVSIVGDLIALSASAAMIPYLLVGRQLRPWMPVFVYAAPVTALAAFLLSLSGLLLENDSHPLGWLGLGTVYGADTFRYTLYVLYLALVPGLVGHTGLNALLRHFPPLIITLVLNMEPLVGSVMGWVAGVQAAPGAFTYLGGGLVFVSTAIVTWASSARERDGG